MHTYADIEVCGPKACKKLKNVLVDTGSTFTSITQADAKEIGLREEMEIDAFTAKGSMRTKLGVAIVVMNGKRIANGITISDAGLRVIGVNTLESLLLRVDPVRGRIEDMGPFRV